MKEWKSKNKKNSLLAAKKVFRKNEIGQKRKILEEKLNIRIMQKRKELHN
jgi:hypothetical protein